MEPPTIEFYVCPRCAYKCVRTLADTAHLPDAKLMLPPSKPHMIGVCPCGFVFTRDMREYRRLSTGGKSL